jgi:hypothetical protein
MKTKGKSARILILWAGLLLLAFLIIEKIIEDSWSFGGETQGPIKSYHYRVKKAELEPAIDQVVYKDFYINYTSKN